MPVKPFCISGAIPMSPDKTEYYHLTSDYVKVEKWGDREMLVVDPEALRVLARQATHDNSFMLRREHNQMVAKILTDPEASENDKFVALTMLRNAEIAAKGQLPFCQDTGTAICIGKKGQNVYTGGGDEEQISHGVYDTYTGCNLRYSQNAPLNMYDEGKHRMQPSRTDRPLRCRRQRIQFPLRGQGRRLCQQDLPLPGDKSAAQSPEARAIPRREDEVARHSRMSPYHIAFVIGGTSAEMNLATVKKASVKYYDNLPTTGNEYGRAFRDVELEKTLLDEAHKIGLGAQFGGKYFAHDIRVIRLPAMEHHAP